MKTSLQSSARLAILIIVAAFSLRTVEAQVQQSTVGKSRFGIFGNVDYTLNIASFSQLPGIPNCCPGFTGDADLGWLGGVSFIDPLSESLSLHVRMHYWSFGASFSETQTQPIVDLQGGPATATLQHDLNASFTQISIEPLIGYRLSKDFSLLGGITAGYIFSSTYDQVETLVEPSDAVFSTNSRQRNALSGKVPNASSLGIGLSLGATYDLPLNAERTAFISPEVLLTLSPLDLVSGISWSAQHIRAGLAFSFIPPAIVDTLSELELYDFARTITPPSKGDPGVAFTSNLSVSGLSSDGRVTPVSAIRIEEFVSTRIRPLLPYVFFDHGSSEIPTRYRSLRSDLVSDFSMNNFYNIDAINTYYHVLNVVGKRMKDNPGATITVSGYIDESEADKGAGLARSRADAVQLYLTDTWDISADRITVVARSTPENASNTVTADGRAENRRVEISSSDVSILAPVESVDTLRLPNPAGLKIQPSIDPRVPIASWTVFVSVNDRLIKTFHGPDPVPPSLEWNISERMVFIPRGSTEMRTMLAVRDSSGAVIPSTSRSIALNEITLDDKSKSGGVDKSIDRYSLILFGFGKSDLTDEHKRVVGEIKKRIVPGATVSIVGYTDKTGDDDLNLRLSDQRAKSVARELGQPESVARGVGEALPQYDNDLPEGRFYSRTVEVVVETQRR
ncbi:MAG: OmpA family protein [Ignavibacteria bacterium]|nr:OmpA family protein [Ignavibacteria bacterium]